eukprot:5324706-Pleurochrysis_carterae.AAC.1
MALRSLYLLLSKSVETLYYLKCAPRTSPMRTGRRGTARRNSARAKLATVTGLRSHGPDRTMSQIMSLDLSKLRALAGGKV